MTGDSTLFHTYTPCHNKSRIRIADGSYSLVAGIGEVQMTGNFSLDKVLHVPNLSCNLLSISKLTKDDKVLAEFSAIGCVIQEQKLERMIDTTKVYDGLYIWNKNSIQGGLALSTAKDDTIMLWHPSHLQGEIFNEDETLNTLLIIPPDPTTTITDKPIPDLVVVSPIQQEFNTVLPNDNTSIKYNDHLIKENKNLSLLRRNHSPETV
ncbi:uncharacterized protein LOC128043074 [Gossypium raimondii]|uniref:uncharacterized protein LOC128043074 n=1 Tax=Gossypium raimondii TaxID=29730 RepID=UPI00227CA328|nr:uncharacterized protein LOC128043074 [Gossypium raimondii]